VFDKERGAHEKQQWIQKDIRYIPTAIDDIFIPEHILVWLLMSFN
jgi:hypothetical protein